LAPECAERRGHNHTVDYWALGVLIFELMAGFPPFTGRTVDDVLESIQAGQREQQGNGCVDFPRKTFSLNAKDLINQLLTVNPAHRLGAKQGASEIKQHSWFKNCDWNLVYEQALRPPLIPTLYHEGDTGNFDSYDELEKQASATQRQLDLFDDW